MALRYKNVRNEKQLKASTGLTLSEFQSMAVYFRQAYLRRKPMPLEEKAKLPHPPAFSTYEDLLFFVLYCQKTGLGYDVLALTFGVSTSTAEANFKEGSKLLQFALDISGSLPENQMVKIKKKDTGSLSIDATGFPVQRPSGGFEAQKQRYSWKHRNHELKSTVLVENRNAHIHYLGKLWDGSVHDLKMLKRELEGYKSALKGRDCFLGSGYQGLLDWPGHWANVFIPFKKSKKHPLNGMQKKVNRFLSSIRVRSEHAIRGMKRYRINAHQKPVHDIQFFETVVRNSAGLWNFKINFREEKLLTH